MTPRPRALSAPQPNGCGNASLRRRFRFLVQRAFKSPTYNFPTPPQHSQRSLSSPFPPAPPPRSLFKCIVIRVIHFLGHFSRSYLYFQTCSFVRQLRKGGAQLAPCVRKSFRRTSNFCPARQRVPRYVPSFGPADNQLPPNTFSTRGEDISNPLRWKCPALHTSTRMLRQREMLGGGGGAILSTREAQF